MNFTLVRDSQFPCRNDMTYGGGRSDEIDVIKSTFDNDGHCFTVTCRDVYADAFYRPNDCNLVDNIMVERFDPFEDPKRLRLTGRMLLDHRHFGFFPRALNDLYNEDEEQMMECMSDFEDMGEVEMAICDIEDCRIKFGGVMIPSNEDREKLFMGFSDGTNPGTDLFIVTGNPDKTVSPDIPDMYVGLHDVSFLRIPHGSRHAVADCIHAGEAYVTEHNIGEALRMINEHKNDFTEAVSSYILEMVDYWMENLDGCAVIIGKDRVAARKGAMMTFAQGRIRALVEKLYSVHEGLDLCDVETIQALLQEVRALFSHVAKAEQSDETAQLRVDVSAIEDIFKARTSTSQAK